MSELIVSAVLIGFNPLTYTATIEVNGSSRGYLENIAVAKNIAATVMINGRRLAVIFFEEYSAADAVVIGVYD